MNMFGHDDVADQGKPVADAHFFKNLHCQISGVGGGEQRTTLITTKGDEMEVAMTGNAFEVLWHRSEERPTLCKLRKGRPPRMAMSYHFTVIFDSGYPSCERLNIEDKACATRLLLVSLENSYKLMLTSYLSFSSYRQNSSMCLRPSTAIS